ncbi:prepilin peptidase [Xenorhabdus mauleonii]|uniref:Prepilin peptidase n=2 Tax=Xenorhabdus mauleonii TaxID=351675 RepID=A0A1I3V6W9_9GAMM|nr:prepilin peptidase [Xenorhabdus mauleonii]SFJ89947.1 leader peptidase (prepilin peptidase) / N-methyltransferase [Xenorhabdus mauleonii]
MIWSFLCIAIPLFAALFAKILVIPAKLFIQTHNGLSLTRLQINSVIATFTLASTSLLIMGVLSNISPIGIIKCWVLLAWGIPLALLDIRNFWLPLRFTTGFWLTGVLFSLLPDNKIQFIESVISSCTMFAIMRLFHYCVNRKHPEERFGLGDVHLIAALCAWIPWQQANVLCGIAFIMFIVGALFTKKHAQPYAPWLFALLAILATFFPLQTIQGVL